MVTDAFNDAIAYFTEEATLAVSHITKQATNDLRGGMREMFFNDEWQADRRAVETLRVSAARDFLFALCINLIIHLLFREPCKVTQKM